MRIITFYLILAFTGCQSSKKIIEFYKSYDKETRSSQTITLNSDYTFNYMHDVGLISSHSKGVWSLKDDSLFIKSDKVYRNGLIEVTLDNSSGIKDSIVITVISEEHQIPIVSALIIIDSLGVYLTTDEFGKVVIASDTFSNFTLSFLGKNYYFTSRNKIKNDIKVFLMEEDLSKTYFDNEQWVKKGNKIIDSNGTVFKFKKRIEESGVPPQE